MVAPTSQKAGVRPISFVLSDQQSGQTNSFAMVIRPEDLSRVEPSRAAVQQTLGSAWVDNFGPGISQINISGHNGWRGGQNNDGEGLFLQMRDTVFTQWHARRAAAAAAGTDPAGVKLVFVDALDHIAVNVVPMSFVLKRNRARPLLMMYQISMVVLGDDVAPTSGEPDDSTDTKSLGKDSLSDSLSKLQKAAANVRNIFAANIAAPVQAFLNTANGVSALALNAISSANGVIVGQTAQIVGLARDISQAGRNAMYAYSAITSMPDALRYSVMDIASSFDNAFCVLGNVFRGTPLYPDYSDIYGASNCSSTSGGLPMSPWRNGNAFDNIFPATQPTISVSPAAQSSINLLRAMDPVQAPPSLGELASRLANSAGISFP